jgi:hypothetical protein
MNDELKIEDRERLKGVGFDPTIKHSGSFLMVDEEVKTHEKTIPDLDILPTKKALDKYPELKDLMHKLVPVDKDEYTLLSKDVEPDGFFFRVKEGVKIEDPVQSCFFINTNQSRQVVHNLIIAEPGSEVHIITGCATASYAPEASHIGITEFFVGEGATLTYTMVHSWGPEVEVHPRSSVVVEEGGLFVSNYIALSQVKHVDMYPTAIIKKNGTARFYSIVYAPENSHLDLGARSHLAGEGAVSDIISRVVSVGGEVISRGHIICEAEGVRGFMECSGLLLEEGGKVHAVPELEGSLPGIELSHEASVGMISEDDIAYIMASGLDEDRAKNLIVQGFLDVRMKGLPADLQVKIDGMVSKIAEEGY